jgi:hypothetical protein
VKHTEAGNNASTAVAARCDEIECRNVYGMCFRALASVITQSLSFTSFNAKDDTVVGTDVADTDDVDDIADDRHDVATGITCDNCIKLLSRDERTFAEGN